MLRRFDFQPLFAPRWQLAWRWLLALMLVVVSWLAFRPGDGIQSIEHLDKLQHLAAFTGLAGVAAMSMAAGRQACRFIAVGLLAYGVFIELVQTQIPTRSGSALDVAADVLGIAVGLLLVHALRKRL